MQDYNSIKITGTVFNEPRCGTTQTKLQMARLTVAVHRPDPSKAIDFLNVIAWNESAEKVEERFHAGDRITVIGSVQNHKYTGMDGQEKRSFRIIASDIEIPDEEMITPVDMPAFENEARA